MRDGRIVYDDLYVLQNEFGLIKVGRTGDVQKRLRELERREECAINLVLLRENKGPTEEWVHRRLRRYLLIGEWFDGGSDSRRAVERALNKGVPLSWPFALDQARADAWLDLAEARRAHRYLLDEFRRFFRFHSALPVGPDLDARLCQLYWLSEHGSRAQVGVTDTGYLVWDPLLGEESPLPLYSGHIETALSLWPVDARPAEWAGSAYDCCIEAVRLLYSRHKGAPFRQPTN